MATTYRPTLDELDDDNFDQPLTSFPTSVEHHLAKAQQMLAQQGNPAVHQAMEAVKMLAISAPEHAAVLVAATMGFRQINAAAQDTEIVTVVDEQFFLGIKVGESRHTTTTTKTSMKSLGLS